MSPVTLTPAQAAELYRLLHRQYIDKNAYPGIYALLAQIQPEAV